MRKLSVCLFFTLPPQINSDESPWHQAIHWLKGDVKREVTHPKVLPESAFCGVNCEEHGGKGSGFLQ